MPPDPVEVFFGPDQWDALTNLGQVIMFGLGLVVFLLAALVVGSFRR